MSHSRGHAMPRRRWLSACPCCPRSLCGFAGARLAKQVVISERRLAALREAYAAGQSALAAAADRVEIVSNTLGQCREDGTAAAAANQLIRSGA